MQKLANRGDARQIASIAEDSANSHSSCVLWRFLSEVVGATGFEPATPCAQAAISCDVLRRHATKRAHSNHWTIATCGAGRRGTSQENDVRDGTQMEPKKRRKSPAPHGD